MVKILIIFLLGIIMLALLVTMAVSFRSRNSLDILSDPDRRAFEDTVQHNN